VHSLQGGRKNPNRNQSIGEGEKKRGVSGANSLESGIRQKREGRESSPFEPPGGERGKKLFLFPTPQNFLGEMKEKAIILKRLGGRRNLFDYYY